MKEESEVDSTIVAMHLNEESIILTQEVILYVVIISILFFIGKEYLGRKKC
jgi:hypothetical protein